MIPLFVLIPQGQNKLIVPDEDQRSEWAELAFRTYFLKIWNSIGKRESQMIPRKTDDRSRIPQWTTIESGPIMDPWGALVKADSEKLDCGKRQINSYESITVMHCRIIFQKLRRHAQNELSHPAAGMESYKKTAIRTLKQERSSRRKCLWEQANERR